ncbi:hypothetical protein HanRHA438_Chr01g0019041 [Helianthus annuus]|nr:hypothetical protein HanRHA438_Chr01g0019041 [Helianthus annuus]
MISFVASIILNRRFPLSNIFFHFRYRPSYRSYFIYQEDFRMRNQNLYIF